MQFLKPMSESLEIAYTPRICIVGVLTERRVQEVVEPTHSRRVPNSKHVLVEIANEKQIKETVSLL